MLGWIEVMKSSAISSKSAVKSPLSEIPLGISLIFRITDFVEGIFIRKYKEKCFFLWYFAYLFVSLYRESGNTDNCFNKGYII